MIARRPRRATTALAAVAAVVSLGGAATLVSAGPAVAGSHPSSPPACPPSWPTFQHDTARTAAAANCAPATPTINAANASTLVPRWFMPTPTFASVTASPAVVGHTVYVGDNAGTFYAIDADTGTARWTFDVTNNSVHSDHHQTSYGVITSSATYADDPVTGAGIVYFGGGGSLFALDAATGAPRWATDLDPDHADSGTEVESSPLLVTMPDGRRQLVVGTDVNENPNYTDANGTTTHSTATGLTSLDPATGALLWKFDPETRTVLHTLGYVPGYACGDVWSSPTFDAADKLIIFATGNCPDPETAAAAGVRVPSEAMWAISATDGSFRWVFSQAGTQADTTYGGDDDFGATPIVVPDPLHDRQLVLIASKAGFIFALDAKHGTEVWDTQAAEPGQVGPAFAGALGGFISSDAVGPAGAGGAPAMFASSAVPLPFKGQGPTTGSPSDIQPDDTLTSNPPGSIERMASLHAVDVATGKTLWHQPLEAPTYAPVTYSNGVVFAPASTSFTAAAYDAATGIPLWVAPLGAAPASGVAVVGPHIFFGAGTTFQSGQPVPPQVFGVWSFGLAGADATPQPSTLP